MTNRDRRPTSVSTFGHGKVEIYTKAWCPYCVRAMKLLASKGIRPIEYDVTMGGPKKAEMVERSDDDATSHID